MGVEAGNRENKGIVGALDVPERAIHIQSWHAHGVAVVGGGRETVSLGRPAMNPATCGPVPARR